ncbi:MAG: M20 family metallopeptidase [Waddliaceae bacterium]
MNELDFSKLPDLLQGLVQNESPDPPGDERKIAEFIGNYLTTENVDFQWDEFCEHRINIISRLTSSQEKPALVFSAHMDTMPVGVQKWRTPPFGGVKEEQRIYGRGASDMKGGIAAMLAAFIALRKTTTSLKGDLILALSAGESSSNMGARRFIEKGQLRGAGALLVSEPSSMKLFIAEKGALWLKLKFNGRSGHCSTRFSPEDKDKPRNAIQMANDFIRRITEEKLLSISHSLLGDTTWSVNKIKGGTAINMVPDYCEVELDIRTIPNQTMEEIIDKLKSIGGAEMEVEVIGIKESVETPPEDSFVRLCQEALGSVLDTSPVPEGVSYFSDATVICPALKIPMAIIGPGEEGMSGQQDEWVNLHNVELAARVFYNIALKYLS